ncbi:membrane-spanning 4-domains subfamily A member 4D-like isoform X1 [Peromyscus californicus insignis]|uniref:membrane-spanning 4-domains subfamily A member 4D-like isoform X1 n=1 Tax=Peromyscus californicus insignis TaxID=564181 RepID=UPI0022A70FC8|nr:membrane-spanning 4-domains subfamily A member 4D-like isoform X1 [Peromyscus californicus insignis]
MQGIEQTIIEVVPGDVQPSEKSVIRSQLWKESTEKFLKGEPKVLGVVQVMIALINLSLGVIMMNSEHSLQILSVYIWAPVWGSIPFMLSGSLSIAAAVRTTKGLVISSITLNTTSSVVAAATSIIGFISVLSSAFRIPYTIRVLVGMDALMFILNVLGFCITVSIAAFGCKASCCTSSEVVVVLPANPAVSAAAPPMSLQPLVPPVYQQRDVPENLYKNPTGGRVQF